MPNLTQPWPTEYALENEQLMRRRKMAELLQQNFLAGDAPQGQMVSGHYVKPALTQYLGQGLKGVLGGMKVDELDKEQLRRSREQKDIESQAMARILSAAKGEPFAGTNEAGMQSNPLYTPPERAPMSRQDKTSNLAGALMNHPNPAYQVIGLQTLLSSLTKGGDQFAKVNPKDYTADSITKFSNSGNFADLVPRDKLEFQNTGGAVVGLNPFTGAQAASTPTSMSPNQSATLAQRQFEWMSLSPEQRAKLQNEAARIGIQGAELSYNTGQQMPTQPFGAPQQQPSQGNPQPAVAGTQGARAILQRELQKEQQRLATASDPQQRQMAQNNIEMITKELSGQPGFVTSHQSAPAMANQALPPKMRDQVAAKAAELQAELAGKRDFNMAGISDTIGEARSILTGKVTPTQSRLGTLSDAAQALVGMTGNGAPQADQLRAISGALIAKMPRMEGPQSNLDVELYRQMAGDVGNSNLPIARRKAALDTVERLYRKYDKTVPDGGFGSGASGGWSIKALP